MAIRQIRTSGASTASTVISVSGPGDMLIFNPGEHYIEDSFPKPHQIWIFEHATLIVDTYDRGIILNENVPCEFRGRLTLVGGIYLKDLSKATFNLDHSIVNIYKEGYLSSVAPTVSGTINGVELVNTGRTSYHFLNDDHATDGQLKNTANLHEAKPLPIRKMRLAK